MKWLVITLLFLGCNNVTKVYETNWKNEKVLYSSGRCSLPGNSTDRYYWPGKNVESWEAYRRDTPSSEAISSWGMSFYKDKGFKVFCDSTADADSPVIYIRY